MEHDEDEEAPSRFEVEKPEDEDANEESAVDNVKMLSSDSRSNEAGTPTTNNVWYVLTSNAQEVQRLPYYYHYHPGFNHCPLCQGRSRVFYCCSCVSKGEVGHSNPRKPGHLAEKRLHITALKKQSSTTAEQIQVGLQTKRRSMALTEEIKLVRQRVKYLRNIVKDKSDYVDRTKTISAKLKQQNVERRKRLPLFVQKVDQIDECRVKHIADLEAQRMKVSQRFRILANERRKHIAELAKYIFPIEAVDVDEENNDDKDREGLSEAESYDSLVAELQDAMSTSHIHGRWVTTSTSGPATIIQLDGGGEKQWRIVAPLLPSDETTFYSALAASSELTATPSAGASSASSLTSGGGGAQTVVTPLHTILGGLTFTAQLLGQVASCLDLVMPKKQSFADFGSATSFSEYAFAKRLVKLNVNTAHLCLSQGLDPKLIKPNEALHNLFTFLTEAAKGNAGNLNKPYRLELLHDMSVTATAELSSLEPTTEEEEEADSDNDDDTTRDWEEWEAVPADMMIVNPYLQHMPSSPSPPPHQIPSSTMSMTAGSFMSSLIRGLTSPTGGTPSSPHK